MADLFSKRKRARPVATRSLAWLLPLVAGACATVPPTLDEAIAALPEGSAEQDIEEATQGQLDALRQIVSDGRPRDALAGLRDLVQARPRLIPARLLLARALSEILEDHGRPGAEREATRTRMQSEEWIDAVREAEIAARGVLEYDDRNAEAWGLLGRIREADGHLEAALEGYDRAIRFGSKNPRVSLSAARVALTLGQERAAVRHLEALRQQNPELPSEVLIWEARCYLTLQDSLRREALTDDSRQRNRRAYLSRARRAFDELAAREPVDARTISGQAYCRYAQLLAGDVDKTERTIDDVRKLYLRAARMSPSDPQPRFDLAVLLESDMIGDAKAAQAMYESALERDPDHLPSLLNVARLLWVEEIDQARAKQIWRKVQPRLAGREKRMVEALLKEESTRG